MKLRYEHEDYGSIVIDDETDEYGYYIVDELDRDTIWDASGHDYGMQQSIYMEIAGELLEEHPDFDELVFERRDFGVRVLIEPETEEWLYLEAGARPAHVA